ncbi:MAG: putative glycoside hydrolase [Pirellulaceae bacterium]
MPGKGTITFIWLVLAMLWGRLFEGAENTSCFPAGVPVLAKGEFIFFSNAVFAKPTNETEAQRQAERLKWIKRFRICLTNGYENFAGEELEQLHSAGCELFIYRWFNGYYEAELPEGVAGQPPSNYAAQFPEIIRIFREIHAHPDWILNHETPMQGGGAANRAYFYDYGNPAFRRFFAASIRRDLDQTGYDGVFFDYIGGWALPAEVRTVWERKYPRLTYDEAGLQFLRELRAVMGAKRIFGNQAYRLGEGYYQLLDYDASESLATSFSWGKQARCLTEDGVKEVRDTFYRPWDSPGGYKEISQARRRRAERHPHVRVCDINYLLPWRVLTGVSAEVDGRRLPVLTAWTDRPAIFYGYAISKLVGGYAYASDWYAEGYGEDDVYFLDLGEPLSERFVETPDTVARYYEHGFVVATRSNERVTFKPDVTFFPKDLIDLWDVFEGPRVHGWASRQSVTLLPSYYPSTNSYYPSGRVYMYLRPTRK